MFQLLESTSLSTHWFQIDSQPARSPTARRLWEFAADKQGHAYFNDYSLDAILRLVYLWKGEEDVDYTEEEDGDEEKGDPAAVAEYALRAMWGLAPASGYRTWFTARRD